MFNITIIAEFIYVNVLMFFLFVSWILVTIIADVGWHWLHGLKVHLRQVKCRALTFAVVADIEATISKASAVGAFAVVGIHSWLVLKLAATKIL